MLLKALGKTVIFILILLLLSWIPRTMFHIFIDGTANIQQLFGLNYLKNSVLFDLKTFSYWFLPLGFYLFLQWIIPAVRSAKWRFGISAVLVFLYLLYAFIAIFYYPVTKTIVGKELFSMLRGQDLRIISSYLMDYWWAVILLLLLTWLLARMLTRVRCRIQGASAWSYALIIIPFWALVARGSVSLKPLNPLDAYAALPAELAQSVMSPPYILIESLGQETLEEVNYLPEAELAKELEKDYVRFEGSNKNKPNICVILLESFGLEYTGGNALGTPSYTPFLDELAKRSVYCSKAYSNGLRSIDAVSALFTGVPAFMNMPYVGSLFAHNDLRSIYDFLANLGYSSSFYHGADRASMGFNPYLRSHGLQAYYGKQDYPIDKDFDGHWGIFDAPYLQYFSEELGKKKEPWISTVFTLSSHHPYTVPPSYADLPEGSLEIHRSIRYTDSALHSFFLSVEKEAWFANTLFIITADHTSISEQKEYQTANGRYRVPLLFYYPAVLAADTITRAVQHLDILPTVLDQLPFKGRVFTYGRSVFAHKPHDIYHFDGNIYSITSDSFNLSATEERVLALYNDVLDPKHQKDLKKERSVLAAELMHKLKVRRQNFNHRLIHNTYH